MKQFILGFVALFAGITSTFGQSTKIAYVNTQVIIDTLPAKDTAEMALAKVANDYQLAIQNLQKELQAKAQEFQAKQQAGASNTQLELLQKSYQRLELEYQETQQMAQQEMQVKRAELFEPLIKDVKAAIDIVARKKGYTSVIDNSAGIVIWTASDNDDLTATVINQMLGKK